jgi:predicted NUDIX family NTP pyrophosphohydrolase
VTDKRSAGILLFRRAPGLEVLIGHMGGPFWSGRDLGAWSIPKGEYESDEDPQAAARREFQEELGLAVPAGELLDLGSVRQANGKVVTIWAADRDIDLAAAEYGTFEMEWPRGSGVRRTFAEIDKAEWCEVDEARPKLVAGQRAFLDRLLDLLS